MFGNDALTALVKRSWVDLSTLNVLISARPVVSTVNWASTSPSTFAERSMSGYRGAVLPGKGATCFSTWNSKNVWSEFTGAGVPPTTPLAIPPATPFPVKSSSFVTFFERSMSGSTSGILIGAVSTWKPFGGGAFMTTSGGGLGWSFGGGGSSFFTVTNSTFSCLGFSNS